MKNTFLLFSLLVLAFSLNAKAQQEVFDDLVVNGKISAISTTKGSIPCPTMTTAQRDAIVAPLTGDCVYNTTLGTLNVYNGTAWKSAGGGVNQWVTGTPYLTNDVVIESNKLYIALADHTSGAFATDLSTAKWQMLNGAVNASTDITGVLPMANGGTDKALTPTLGGIVYTDAGSMEILAPGTAGQVLQTNGAAAPTFVNKSISGKAGSNTSVTVEEIQVPNNQLTETATNKHNIETGNANKLINPEFEHSTVSTGWSTSVTGTATASITAVTPSVFKEGNKSGKLTCAGGASGGTCLFYQDVLTVELQGIVKALAQTTATSGVKFLTRVNGVNNLSKDIQPVVNNTLRIPQVLGSTSTGIAFEVTVSASQTIDVNADSTFVGAQNLLTEVPTCDGSAACETEFSAYIAPGASHSGENLDWISTSTFSSPNYVLNLNTAKLGLAVGMNCSTTADNATREARLLSTSPSVISLSVWGTDNVNGKTDTGFWIKCSKTGTDYTKAKATSPGFSTTNADTDWASCGHTTSDFTGFGTVTNIETQCKRQGSDLLMRGKFTSGTPTAVEARVGLKFNGVSLTSANTTKIPSLQIAGDAGTNTASTSYFRTAVVIEPSVAYFMLGSQAPSISIQNKITGSNLLSSGNMLTFNARIPISGWENSNVIIGSFKDVVTIQGISNPRLYSIYGNCDASSAIAKEYGANAISISNVSSGVCSVTLPSTVFSEPAICTSSFAGNIASTNERIVTSLMTTATNLSIDCNGSGADCTAYDFNVTCIGKAP